VAHVSTFTLPTSTPDPLTKVVGTPPFRQTVVLPAPLTLHCRTQHVAKSSSSKHPRVHRAPETPCSRALLGTRNFPSPRQNHSSRANNECSRVRTTAGNRPRSKLLKGLNHIDMVFFHTFLTLFYLLVLLARCLVVPFPVQLLALTAAIFCYFTLPAQTQKDAVGQT